MTDITESEWAFLVLFGEFTHGINMPSKIAVALEEKGMIEWLPPLFGTTLYQITDAGRAAVAKAMGA